MGTHFLETTEGGTCQDMEGKQPSNGHSQTGDHRGKDLSGHGKKPIEQWALTSWSPQREGLVSTWKESDQVISTHILENTDGGTGQDMA